MVIYFLSRFTTTGEQALTFELFKYVYNYICVHMYSMCIHFLNIRTYMHIYYKHCSIRLWYFLPKKKNRYGRPDPQMERSHDVSVKLKMASVRYLHTMRFLKEMLAFCSHFPQLIDAFQRMKAIAQGNLVSLYLGSIMLLSIVPHTQTYAVYMYVCMYVYTICVYVCVMNE